jgi:hypothetical protein
MLQPVCNNTYRRVITGAPAFFIPTLFDSSQNLVEFALQAKTREKKGIPNFGKIRNSKWTGGARKNTNAPRTRNHSRRNAAR